MPDVVINVSSQIENYIKRHGFAEIFLRDNQARCTAITKALLKKAEEGQKNTITNIGVQAAQNLGLSESSLVAFKNDLLKQIDPQTTRRQLAKLAKGQSANTALLKDLSKNVSSIYSMVSCIQAVTWLNAALSAANIAATVASTVIICKKLDNIDKKLDRIECKIDSIKQVQYVDVIKQPCIDFIREYKVISDEFGDNKEVSANKVLEEIKKCCSLMEKIYDIRNQYFTGDVLELLYDLMPAYTDLIIQYYAHFYESSKGEYTLHKDWLSIFDKLDSETFRNEIQDYLIMDERVDNIQLNQIMDCQHLVTIGSRQKIEEALSDLSLCDSAEDYRDIMQFSKQYALQQAKSIESEMISQFGASQAEEMMEYAKNQYMFAS